MCCSIRSNIRCGLYISQTTCRLRHADCLSKPLKVIEVSISCTLHPLPPNTNTCLLAHFRDPWPSGNPPAADPSPPSWLRRSGTWPTNQGVLLQQSTGLPLPTTLLALLRQQGEDSSGFDTWLQHAAEWDSYQKREKEGGSLLLHLLRTGRGVGDCGMKVVAYQRLRVYVIDIGEARGTWCAFSHPSPYVALIEHRVISGIRCHVGLISIFMLVCCGVPFVFSTGLAVQLQSD